MKEKIGNIIYWAACLIAAFIFYRFMPSIKSDDIPESAVLFALGWGTACWLAGWAARYFLSGNKSIRFK